MKYVQFKSVKEYADMVGLSIPAIYKQIREKRIKYQKFGNTYLIPIENELKQKKHKKNG